MENKNGPCSDTRTPNRCIRCTVTQCANHCGKEDFCLLSTVQIGTHEANPTQTACTDCLSFRLNG